MNRRLPTPDDSSERLDPSREKGTRRLLWTWIPTILYVAAILLMAMRPAPVLPSLRHIDKYFHAAAYALLALISFRTFYRSSWRYPLLAALLLGSVVGALDETVQYFGKVRTADLYDWCADSAGTIIGGLVATGLHRRGKK